MKKYRLLVDGEYDDKYFQKGNVYPHNYLAEDGCRLVAELAKLYPYDWELIEDEEKDFSHTTLTPKEIVEQRKKIEEALKHLQADCKHEHEDNKPAMSWIKTLKNGDDLWMCRLCHDKVIIKK